MAVQTGLIPHISSICLGSDSDLVLALVVIAIVYLSGGYIVYQVAILNTLLLHELVACFENFCTSSCHEGANVVLRDKGYQVLRKEAGEVDEAGPEYDASEEEVRDQKKHETMLKEFLLAAGVQDKADTSVKSRTPRPSSLQSGSGLKYELPGKLYRD
ncbi:hypothetical protein F52700_11998 [Fusarium sp. NRRL 52700]|nr:hypothetical protein F52700_11998 [Fusarium sp. NRRL 52700]